MRTSRLTCTLSLTLGLGLFLASGCGEDSPNEPNEPPPPTGQVADFTLPDMNPNSLTYGQPITARQHQGGISAWYFGAAT
jgi:hypothetical protein